MAQTKFHISHTKTDNSYIADKVALRAGHLPDGDVAVLDCYAGSGVIWCGVAALTGRRIRRLPIDIKNDVPGFHLPGDNLCYLATLDLARFNVIDLDAYGVPFAQLETLFSRQYHGRVFCTVIQSAIGELPHGLLLSVGYTQPMIDKCRTLLFRHGYDEFTRYLAQKGVRRLWERTHARKHYIGFDV